MSGNWYSDSTSIVSPNIQHSVFDSRSEHTKQTGLNNVHGVVKTIGKYPLCVLLRLANGSFHCCCYCYVKSLPSPPPCQLIFIHLII